VKGIVILGSTGSIGQSALEVIRHFPRRFRVIGLSTNSNIDLLYKQIEEFSPLFVCVRDINASVRLKQRLSPSRVKLFTGEEGLEALVKNREAQEILVAISGAGALLPLLKAIENDKQIALANKEALVMAGPIIMNMAKRKKINIIPVDSEQSAIWQCLQGENHLKLKNIYLTASGGPFRKVAQRDLKSISVEKVLKHPKWKMGRKISVDSANLMNKGLELLEAMFLFNMPSDKIKILIHPEAIVHSMVEFIDGIVLAQLAATDMRIPIQYALSYPERLTNSLPCIDFYKLQELHFEKPDFKKFPCLRLAYRVAAQLGTMPAVLNAANEVSVEEFLKSRLKFLSIPKIIEKVLDRHSNKTNPSLGDIQEADAWARREAYKLITG
jgi:1-deoxy-D-xylulose-5-phosphate reductoisomerase